MFNQLARHNWLRLPNSQRDFTFTYREFVLMFKNYKVFATFQGITIRNVIDQFSELVPGVLDGAHFNMEEEV
jgi:hypothetical protein